MINERINKLRQVMKKHNIDAYYVPTDDFHMSEMVGDYFQGRRYLSGFTGSAGQIIVTQTEARLWTDGRYFLQAEDELKGSEVILMKQGEPGVLDTVEYLTKELKTGQTLGLDGRCIPAAFGNQLKALFSRKQINLVSNVDLLSEVWTERPEISKEPSYLLDTKYTGKDSKTKLLELRERLKANNLDMTIISSLDDIMWLYNIRGNDVLYTPVTLSYTLVSLDKAVLYIHSECLNEELKNYFNDLGVLIKPYNDIYQDVKNIDDGKNVYLELNKTNYLMYSSIPQAVNVINGMNLTTLDKACKNIVEQENMKKAHIIDGVAVCKFIYWLKQNVGKIAISECSAASKLLEFRQEAKSFIEPSFETIAGYNHHGAIVHYEPTKETDIPVYDKGLLLVDSGGHYLEGTTDITRTIVLGPISSKCKKDFTNVLKGYLDLLMIHFKEGARGSSLDVLARQALWANNQDFNHGTGHGVGYLLNVHEGPQSIHYGRINGYPFKDGMITSDEPGIYIQGEYGIRHESLILCKKDVKNEYGQFMHFEAITMVPFDLDGIDPSLLTSEEKTYLNNYHKEVYERISPFLNKEEASWLKDACKSI